METSGAVWEKKYGCLTNNAQNQRNHVNILFHHIQKWSLVVTERIFVLDPTLDCLVVQIRLLKKESSIECVRENRMINLTELGDRRPNMDLQTTLLSKFFNDTANVSGHTYRQIYSIQQT